MRSHPTGPGECQPGRGDLKPIQPSALPEPTLPAAGEPSPAGDTSFGQILSESLARVAAVAHQADRATEMSATDGAATLDHTLRVLRKAEVSFLLMIQVRKKIFDTYREVLCMEVE